MNASSENLEEQHSITKKFVKEASMRLFLIYGKMFTFKRTFFFFKEIMENFDHPHIIKLIGVCFHETLFIVMELAKFGQLARYLQANKDHIETNTLVLYCYQLSSAMAYLESKKFVHRCD